MDLNQLANLGEFIGGVAVLVTLVCLTVAVQELNQKGSGDCMLSIIAPMGQEPESVT